MNKLYCDKTYLKYIEKDPDDCCYKNCENCFTKEFWENVLCEADRHILYLNKSGYYDVYSVASIGEGGFYNTKFRITFKNGDTKDCGLWHRGRCPNVVNFSRKISEVTDIKSVGRAGEDNK